MTAQQTTFARELAKGTDRETAYRTAYPAAHDMRPATVAAKASALAASPAIVAAVDRLRGADRDGAASDETGETMDADEAARLLTEQARRIHAEGGRPADLVRTLSLLADLQGWRRPATVPDAEAVADIDLTDAERAAMARAQLYGEGPETPDAVRAESIRLADEVRRKRNPVSALDD